MPEKELPARPNLEQYRKQAKDLARDCGLKIEDALNRVHRHHPQFADLHESARMRLSDAQLVIAREHGFATWPEFATHITRLETERRVAQLDDPVAGFLRAATVPRDDHDSGTLEEAEMILARHPEVAHANIYTAAVLGDASAAQRFLALDKGSAVAKGGPHAWDALTYLCFSRYLRIDRDRSEGFVRTARALLEAGASANTGWQEMIDYPNPRPILESAIYGAAGVAQHAGVAKLLLDYGADPNDEETPYHAAEGYDLTVLGLLLASGRLNDTSLSTLLLRKADWHDTEGIRLLLEHGADPNALTRWKHTGLQWAIQRDNRLAHVALMLDHGGDPTVKNLNDGRSSLQMAAHRGRGDVLRLFQERGFALDFSGADRLIAACALADDDSIGLLTKAEPHLAREVGGRGGTLLAEFAGNGNAEGVRRLLDLGVRPDALYSGDGYWDVARDSTALHVAAWRMWAQTVRLLIELGAPVNARDAKGRTALALAVKACVDSYWKDRRTPESVEALLNAGATLEGIDIPSGYGPVDDLLQARQEQGR